MMENMTKATFNDIEVEIGDIVRTAGGKFYRVTGFQSYERWDNTTYIMAWGVRYTKSLEVAKNNETNSFIPVEVVRKANA